jgi:hypothetical protein
MCGAAYHAALGCVSAAADDHAQMPEMCKAPTFTCQRWPTGACNSLEASQAAALPISRKFRVLVFACQHLCMQKNEAKLCVILVHAAPQQKRAGGHQQDIRLQANRTREQQLMTHPHVALC